MHSRRHYRCWVNATFVIVTCENVVVTVSPHINCRTMRQLPARTGQILQVCALFALFCFTIVIVCAPNPFFLSLFTLFLVACWLSLIRRLLTSGGSIPWLQSLTVLLPGPVPWPRRCSCSVPSLASAVLGSSASPWCSFSAPHLTSSTSTWCSARNLRPRLGDPLRPRLSAPPRLLGALHECLLLLGYSIIRTSL